MQNVWNINIFIMMDEKLKVLLMAKLRILCLLTKLDWILHPDIWTRFYMCVCVCVYIHMYLLSCSVTSNSLRPHGLQPSRLLCPWDSLGKNTGVGCHSLLQIFLSRGLNLSLLHYRWILYYLIHQRSPCVCVLITQSCPTLWPQEL